MKLLPFWSLNYQYILKITRSIKNCGLGIRSAILAIGFGCLHLIFRFLMSRTSVAIGKVKSSTVPLFAKLEFQFSPWILPAIAILVGFNFFVSRFASKRSTFLILSFLFFWAIGLSVSMIDGFRPVGEELLPAFLVPYTRTDLEYYGDVPLVNGVGFFRFLKNYPKPEIFDQLSLHSKTHPPGGVIFLWFVSKIFGRGLLAASLATIGFTSLTIIPFYILSKEIYNESVAKNAIMIFLVMPNFVMFTTTSMDGVFSVFSIVSVYLFFKMLHSTDLKISIAFGISMAFGFMLSYSSIFVGLFFAVYALLIWQFDCENFDIVLKRIIIAFASFVGFFILIFLVSGFNIGESLIRSIQKDAEMMGSGYESLLRYFLISIGNLSAFMIGIGLPIVILWGQNINNYWREKDLFPIAFLISLLVIAFSTLYTMEVERIWIFMAPFVVLPIAKLTSRAELRCVIALLSAQLIIMEIFFNTYW